MRHLNHDSLHQTMTLAQLTAIYNRIAGRNLPTVSNRAKAVRMIERAMARSLAALDAA